MVTFDLAFSVSLGVIGFICLSYMTMCYTSTAFVSVVKQDIRPMGLLLHFSQGYSLNMH